MEVNQPKGKSQLLQPLVKDKEKLLHKEATDQAPPREIQEMV